MSGNTNDGQAAALRAARENRSWGDTRIQGALANLGREVVRSTLAEMLNEAGLDPAPERPRRTTWNELLRTHWEVLAAADFFTVEIWNPAGLIRYQVFFVIRLASRAVKIAGIVPEPTGPWRKQMVRNLTDGWDGLLNECRYFIHDPASLFTKEFESILRTAAINSVRLPARSPNLYAYAERFVRTIKESCLDRMILIGEASLHRATSEFVTHYRRERHHQGLQNRIIEPESAEYPTAGTIDCRKRLGGILRYYYQEAA